MTDRWLAISALAALAASLLACLLLWRRLRAAKAHGLWARVPAGDIAGRDNGDRCVSGRPIKEQDPCPSYASLNSAIVESSPNGIIRLDSACNIKYMNEAAQTMLYVGVDRDFCHRNFNDVVGIGPLYEKIAKTMADGKYRQTVITVDNPRTGKSGYYLTYIMHVGGGPDAAGNGAGFGVIYMQDITAMKRLELIRNDFVSNITHELKTPLTSIKGFIETLRYGDIDDDRTRDKFLGIIEIEAERLNQLIDSILSLAEVDSIAKEGSAPQIPIGEVIDEVLLILSQAAAQKGVTLSNETPDPGLTYGIYQDRAKQLLINLVENAIKYNVAGGSVKVGARQTEGGVSLTVADTGIGIPKDKQEFIFDRFYRVNKNRPEVDGSGLGLAICKQIALLYGGGIKVESALGEGTTITVELPLR
ncbi:MAG: PAS domain-containing sensor histidine kinase [Oscillospiraceae bacterium]|nr:PAS domain-containing sensor histidine kinase [Oscillospiraceae bacterium]